jgi:eukaryotic-like serine/threonine-protein kinase
MVLAPGTRLGPYELTGALGAGGMGQVYRARDTRLERNVAIKLLADANDPGAPDRLLREARSASALNHPNVCTLHEIGDADGTPFIVMELVEGEPLDRRIAGSGLSLPAVLRIGAQIADGLAHAHARGIVHRDLKSANVAITSDGRPKILDFGIARQLATSHLAEATQSIATLTADNEIAGTLPYMAPELLEGRPANPRSDLWALGVMLVEMATGARPFRGETGLALSTAILRDPPQLPASTPEALAAIVRKLLEKNPADRYGSAVDVAADLGRLGEADGMTAEKRVPGGAAFRWVVAAALVAVLSLGTAWWSLASRRSNGALAPASINSIAVLPLDNLSGSADQQYFADGMTEALISHLSAIDDLRVISRTSVMQFKNTTQPLGAIAAALKVDAVVEGAVMRTADHVRITARLIDARTERPVWRGEYEKPLSDAIGLQREVAAMIGREIRGELTTADTARLARHTDVDPQAYQLYLQGRFNWNLRGKSDLTRAAALFEDAIHRDPDFAPAHAGVADVYVLLGDFRDMLPAEAYARAREAVDTALRLDPTLPEAHTTRAWLSFAVDRDWAAAEQSFGKALQLNPGYATAHQWRGEFLAALGRFEEAFSSFKRAEELDPLALMPQAIHGWTAYIAGRYEEAINLCEAVLARDPGFRPARMYRAWTRMEQNRLDEAEREVTSILQASSSPGVPVATLGRIEARRGNRIAAHNAIERLRALPYQPSFDIAKVHAELREREEALRWLEKAETEQNSAVLYIKVDRSFSWLRGDPRFDALLKKLRLF